MRGRRWWAWLVVGAVILTPLRAMAASVTYRDPDDFEIAPDVQLTTKQGLLVEGLGRRIRFSASGDLGPRYRLRVLVDAHGDRAADFVLIATVKNLELNACVVRPVGGPRIDARCGGDPQQAWWGMSRRDLRPDKRIRWRIVALRGPTFSRLTDRAPDAGWYR